jgi:hypothetical protein
MGSTKGATKTQRQRLSESLGHSLEPSAAEIKLILFPRVDQPAANAEPAVYHFAVETAHLSCDGAASPRTFETCHLGAAR